MRNCLHHLAVPFPRDPPRLGRRGSLKHHNSNVLHRPFPGDVWPLEPLHPSPHSHLCITLMANPTLRQANRLLHIQPHTSSHPMPLPETPQSCFDYFCQCPYKFCAAMMTQPCAANRSSSFPLILRPMTHFLIWARSCSLRLYASILVSFRRRARSCTAKQSKAARGSGLHMYNTQAEKHHRVTSPSPCLCSLTTPHRNACCSCQF
jgi:hypothetical protein